MQENPGSALQERFAYGRADPARAAGDQRGLAPKPLYHVLLLNSRWRASIETEQARVIGRRNPSK